GGPRPSHRAQRGRQPCETWPTCRPGRAAPSRSSPTPPSPGRSPQRSCQPTGSGRTGDRGGPGGSPGRSTRRQSPPRSAATSGESWTSSCERRSPSAVHHLLAMEPDRVVLVEDLSLLLERHLELLVQPVRDLDASTQRLPGPIGTGLHARRAQLAEVVERRQPGPNPQGDQVSHPVLQTSHVRELSLEDVRVRQVERP